MSHPWEQAVKAFEELASRSPPPQNAILFTGSSTITMWTTLAEDFPFAPVINRGFGGSQMEDLVVFAERIITSCHPAIVVIYSGDNDLAAGKGPEQVTGAARGVLRKIRSGCGNIPVVLIGPKPSLSRWHLAAIFRQTNRLFQNWVEKEPNTHFVDVWPIMIGHDGSPRRDLFGPDGLHMARKGYEEWINILSPLLRGLYPFQS